jgi:hypothetical protein
MPSSDSQYQRLEGREGTPGCSPDPPDLTQPLPLLRYLLGVELRRLEVATRLETERNFVFPETTIIIRDIQKLQSAIKETEGRPHSACALGEPCDDDDDVLQSLRAAMEEHS